MAHLLKSLSQLRLWKRNYHAGNVVAVKASIRRFGYNRSISVWREDIVAAGNTTLKALRELHQEGIEPPPNVIARDGDWWIETTDVSHLTEKEAEAYAVSENHTNVMGHNDDEALAALLKELAEQDDATLLASTGYTEDDLDALLKTLMDETAPAPDTAGQASVSSPRPVPLPLDAGNALADAGDLDTPEYIPPSSAVRMVQLILDNTTLAEFHALCEALKPRYGTTTPTDTVMEALRHANAHSQ